MTMFFFVTELLHHISILHLPIHLKLKLVRVSSARSPIESSILSDICNLRKILAIYNVFPYTLYIIERIIRMRAEFFNKMLKLLKTGSVKLKILICLINIYSEINETINIHI